MKPYTEGEIQSFNRSLEDGIEPQRGGIDPYDLPRWLVTVARLSARVAKLEAALRKWQEWSERCPPRLCDDGSNYYSQVDWDQAEREAEARAALEDKS